jgi:hypothetical protein
MILINKVKDILKEELTSPSFDGEVYDRVARKIVKEIKEEIVR